jgi:integrase
MAVYKQTKSKYWWYKFTWNGDPIRESTKQTNKRVAEQMEAAHRTALAKDEVGIRDKKPVPTLKDFAEHDFLPYVERTLMEKEPNTARFYATCAENLDSFSKLSTARLDEIGHDVIQAFIEFRRGRRFEFRSGKRQERRDSKPAQVSTVNRDLATLRRMLNLAVEWGKLRAAPKVRLLPGENRRERALAEAEDALYVKAATDLGLDMERTYQAALEGIRATIRGEQPHKPDAFRLRDSAVTMLDTALRPDEVFRLRSENVREGAICIFEGKTRAAVRRIPIMTERLRGILEMRLSQTEPGGWLFPADTKSGHIGGSSLRKQHAKALKASGVAPFELYTLRHTCLTRWGEYMDPWRLHKYAGHADMKTTARYIHPRDESMQDAMERNRAARETRLARSGHTSRHTTETAESAPVDEIEAIN